MRHVNLKKIKSGHKLLATTVALLLFALVVNHWMFRNVVTIGDVAIPVEVADSDTERVRGLSGQDSLGENSGLLMVFDEPTKPLVWMKDMQFPIDIIWIDERQQIVDISHNISPLTYPQTFSPSRPVKFVLEVNAGFATQHGFTNGQAVEF